MAGLMQEVKSSTLLSNYTRMYSVLGDAAQALTTDSGLSLSAMVSLAEDLRRLTTKSVQFLTAPNVPDPANNNRVIWQQPEASKLFYAIAHDTTLPKIKKQPVRPPATASPSLVRVEVLNGNGLPGAAGQAASELASRGFTVIGAANAANPNYTSSYIEYASLSDMPAVNTLKADVSSVRLERVPTMLPGSIVLIIGSTFHGLSSPASSSSSSRAAQNLSKSFGGINASANICSNHSAFAGPDNPNQGT
jgi:hypothetical protein